MVKVMNLQKTYKKTVAQVSSAEVEIQIEDGINSLKRPPEYTVQ